MEISKIKSLVNEIWGKVINEINTNPSFYPSEKTMVFRFAWLLQKASAENINFLFEKIVLKNQPEKRKVFLDLYFEIDDIRIGIEFKFPKKSELSSNNQTQRRISIIKDIERLNNMVVENEIDLGVFLLASDIKPYTQDSVKRTTSKDYKIHHKYSFKKNAILPPFEIEKSKLICDVTFNWNDIDKIKLREHFASIEPIFINA